VFDLFRCISDEHFLAPLREATGSLKMQQPGAAFSGMSAALEGVESAFRCGEKVINGFLEAYGTLPCESWLTLDETEPLRYQRLTDGDILFLVNASETMRQVAEILHECSCMCRKDVLPFAEFSNALSRAVSAVLHHNEAFMDAKPMVLPMLVSMWRPGLSVNRDGNLVRGAGNQ